MSLYQQIEPPIVSRLSDTLKAIRAVVGAGLVSAGVTDPIEVIIGYPTWTEATKVLAQPVDPGFVTIDALDDARFVTRYAPEWGQVGPTITAFAAAFTPATVTLSAVPGVTQIAGTNLHAFFTAGANAQLYDASYTSIASDTPSTVATALKNAILALAVGGVGASAVGDVVTLTGGALTTVNVGGTAAAHKEIARVRRTVKVSIWVSSPWVRLQCHEGIVTNLGPIDECWLTLPDGGRVLVLPRAEKFDDQSQESTNVYIAHMTYEVEYGYVQRSTATQICAADLTALMQNELGQQVLSLNSIAS